MSPLQGEQSSAEDRFSNFSVQYSDSYSEIREAEWCSGSNEITWHEIAWISTFALIGARMWPWVSLGLICKMGVIVITSSTIIVRVVRDSRVKCTLWPGTQRAPRNVAPPSGLLACNGTYMLDEVA